MIVGCKRLLAPYADLLEPYQKRSRLDAHMAGPEEEPGHEGYASASCPSPVIDQRRRQVLDDFQDLSSEQPAEKRLRLGDHFAGGLPGASLGGNGVDNRDVAIRRWAEDIVKALHGCPSVEEAVHRCARALSNFDAEAREAALREMDSGEESVQSLQYTKKVLMRAVSHLAQRCRQNEAAVGEADALREELEKAREAQSRLAHHNEMLKHHLRLELDR
mmetsp:Transcript_43699/g.121537  ORF Transcript_43699/g.121537 Transcript_43699/m.121537 type:complete len:218 (+) Transcript_43699:122-775(+)